ncbi:unnamed protein product [Alopecurus aequalis]
MSDPQHDGDQPPPAKQIRDMDPIAPTNHPWNLPATVNMLHRCDQPEYAVLVIPREANLPIDARTKRVVARVSQAVVAVASYDDRGDMLGCASGFIAEFDESSMTGTVLSSATVANISTFLGEVDKIRVHLFDGASYDATVAARDDHWNLLALSVRFDSVVNTMDMVEISENTTGHFYPHTQFVHSDTARVTLSPGDTVIGLGRRPQEPFGLQANRGVYSGERWANIPRFCQEMQKATFISTYTAIGGPVINTNGRVIGMLFHDLDCTPFLPSNVILKWWDHFRNSGKYCRPKIGVFGVNLRLAQTSAWGNVPKSLYEGFDGFVVEQTSRAVRTVGLQKNDLIIQCNGKFVATSLQLFEILAENVEGTVDVTFVKAEGGKKCSVLLPVEETLGGNFHCWPISQYNL